MTAALRGPYADVALDSCAAGLILLQMGPEATLRQAEAIAEGVVQDAMQSHANVLWGATIDEEYRGRIEICVILASAGEAALLES